MEEKHKIFAKSLPSILDDLDSAIRQVEQLAKAAQESARESRAAAGEAKGHADKAAEQALKAAKAAVAAVDKKVDHALAEIQDNRDRLDNLYKEVTDLKVAFRQQVSALGDVFSGASRTYQSETETIKT